MTTGRPQLGHALTVLGFLASFVAVFGWILLEAGTIRPFGERYEVSAVVPTANFLSAGARVTAAGAEVGQVISVKRSGPRAATATIRMEITDDSVFPLPSDSRVQVRTRSQVGENYVSLAIGASRTTVPDKGSIGVDEADPFVSVDEVLTVLSGETKERTRTLLQDTGAALSGRGADLNRTLRNTSTFVDTGVATLDTLAPDHRRVARLVDQLGRVMAAIGDRDDAVQTLARRGTAALQAIAARDTQLAETLRALPGTLTQAKATAGVLGDVSDRATPVVSELASAVRALDPAVRALAPAARDGRRVVTRLDDAVPELQQLLRAAPGAIGSPADDDSEATGLLAATGPLRDMACELNPTLRYIEPRTKDLWSVIPHLGSTSNPYDATGHLVRLVPLLNENSLSGAPPTVQKAAQTLLSSGAFFPQKRIRLDAYPEIGSIGTRVAEPDDPQTPAEYGKKFKYPRVEAEC